MLDKGKWQQIQTKIKKIQGKPKRQSAERMSKTNQ